MALFVVAAPRHEFDVIGCTFRMVIGHADVAFDDAQRRVVQVLGEPVGLDEVLRILKGHVRPS